MRNDIVIRQASAEDITSVGMLYDSVNSYFEKTVNYCYPNWQKGKYPVLADAENAFAEQTLYIMKMDGIVLGAVIIDCNQHPEYKKIPWSVQASDEQVMTIHTLVMHPDYRNQGLGEKMVHFAMDHCKEAGAVTIRLDTHYRNIPARRLYEKCGFRSLGKVEAYVDDVIQEFDVFEYTF